MALRMKTYIPLTFLALTGCAAIIDGTQQPLTIDTTPVRGAECTLTNDKGSWTLAETPGQIIVHRAYDDLTINCKKDDMTGLTVTESKTKGWFWGNILFGGIIGMSVDGFGGAGYDYPTTISVPLSK